ncbi:hypothetical protein PABG_03486 [Paracoccidioides brasiliensis Pb03]|nr:hypothetical protein PABG_03486 [Paracoccidioides brasiliensis Pb03]
MSPLSTIAAKQFHVSSSRTLMRAPSTQKTMGKLRCESILPPGSGTIRLTMKEAESLVNKLPRSLFEFALPTGEPERLDLAMSVAAELIRIAATRGAMHGNDILNQEADLTILSRIAFILSKHPDYRAVAEWWLYRLAESMEPFAILYIVNRQFAAGPIKRTVLIDYLEYFAQRHLVDAMVLYGQILHERHNRTEEALVLFTAAMEISVPTARETDSLDEDLYSVLGIPQAWEMYASVKATTGDKQGIREAVEMGAFKLDHPTAFKFLAKIIAEEGHLDKYEEYMTKAAMDCDAEACHELGSFYLELYYDGKGRDNPPGPSKGQDVCPKDLVARKYTNRELLQNAIDWLEIASTGGWGPSALIMATLLREAEKPHKGLRYLKIAEEDENSASRAKEVRLIYLDKTFKLNIEQEILSKQFTRFD